MMKPLIRQLEADYPEFAFVADTQFAWSSSDTSIRFDVSQQHKSAQYSLIHELAHGILGHTNYTSDFELLKLEAAAWEEACQVGKKYKVFIPDGHVQSCLDTYRDWLHIRSTCPTCSCNGFQDMKKAYHCINCRAIWTVSSSRLCRPYRRRDTKKEAHIRTLLQA